MYELRPKITFFLSTDAAFESGGIYVNGNFHADKFLKAYENSLNNRTSEEKKMWMPVIEKAIALCEKSGKKFFSFSRIFYSFFFVQFLIRSRNLFAKHLNMF